MEKLFIWGNQIPGNSTKSKEEILDIHDEYTQEDIFRKYPGIWDKSTTELGDLSGNATMVYRQEIKNGPAKMTFEDEPFIVPFVVEGSKKTILICPGGGYLSKSMIEEGSDVARFLNSKGISAFVLWYRSYPYFAPIMFLDCQRAIRYIRYHANNLGIANTKIGIVGFSAGGNLAGVTHFIFRNKPIDFEGYVPDKIDEEDATLDAFAGVYPGINLYDEKKIAVMAGREIYDDTKKREAFAKKYDVFENVQENDIPIFLCGASDDTLTPTKYLIKLASIALEKEVDIEMHIFAEGGHGFGACLGEQMPQFYHNREFVIQWLELFAVWVDRVLK